MKPTPLEESSVGRALSFTLPETHQLLRDSVRRFAEAEIAPLARQLDPAPDHLPPDRLRRTLTTLYERR